MTRSAFNKVILFTVYSYLDKQLSQVDYSYQKDALREMTTKIMGFRNFHKFTLAEAKEIKTLGGTPAFEAVRKIEVDYSIYAIELLYLWVELVPRSKRPVLNISDKKIKKIRADLTMDMLRLRHSDVSPERIEEVKGIVAQSKLTAKKFTYMLDEEVS